MTDTEAKTETQVKEATAEKQEEKAVESNYFLKEVKKRIVENEWKNIY